MFVNNKMRALYEKYRRAPIQYGSFIYVHLIFLDSTAAKFYFWKSKFALKTMHVEKLQKV